MYKTVIATAILAAPAWGAAAQDGVTLYGTVDNYIEAGDTGSARVTRMQSGGVFGSKIGLRGTGDLGGGTRALLTLETGINADDGSLGQGGLLFGRQAFAGLSGRYGTLTAGRQYSPVFTTMATYGMGGGMGWGNAAVNFTDLTVLRIDNAINYAAPPMAGVGGRLFFAPGERAVPGQPHAGDMAGGALQYDRGLFSATVSFFKRKTTSTNADRWWTAGASHDFGFVRTGLVFQRRSDDLRRARTAFVELSALFPLGLHSVLVDAGALRSDTASRADARFYAVRYGYYLSTRSMLYAGLARVKNEANARVTIHGASAAGMTLANGNDPSALVLGLRHVF